VRANNSVYGCGSKIGNGASAPSTPELVLTDVTDMTTGASHTAVMARGNTLLSWGDNQYGQLAPGRRWAVGRDIDPPPSTPALGRFLELTGRGTR
jgi:alpha-tubulin suppressor-like RCC1 family protein